MEKYLKIKKRKKWIIDLKVLCADPVADNGRLNSWA